MKLDFSRAQVQLKRDFSNLVQLKADFSKSTGAQLQLNRGFSKSSGLSE